MDCTQDNYSFIFISASQGGSNSLYHFHLGSLIKSYEPGAEDMISTGHGLCEILRATTPATVLLVCMAKHQGKYNLTLAKHWRNTGVIREKHWSKVGAT